MTCSSSSTLSGRTALITGAARRLGREIALALAEQGVDVMLHYRASREEVESLAVEVRERGVRAWVLDADLADAGAASALISRAIEAAGPLDILINNASIFEESRLDTFTPEDLSKNMAVNAMAPALLARDFVQALGERRGDVVNFLDCRIVDYDSAHVAYHVSKRTLFSLTRMMALEYAPNVHVNAVAPGLILPPEGKDEAYLRALAETNPLQSYGGPEDVVDAVVFLLKSRFITGQVIFVDGGRHMRGAMYG